MTHIVKFIAFLVSLYSISEVMWPRDAMANEGTLVIRLSSTLVETEVSPLSGVWRTKGSATIKVYKDGTVETSGFREGHAIQGSFKLGIPSSRQDYNKVNHASRMRVQNGGFTISYFGDTYKTMSYISKVGNDSCAYKVDASLLPGHKLFEGTRMRNGDHMYISDMHYEDLKCDMSIE